MKIAGVTASISSAPMASSGGAFVRGGFAPIRGPVATNRLGAVRVGGPEGAKTGFISAQDTFINKSIFSTPKAPEKPASIRSLFGPKLEAPASIGGPEARVSITDILGSRVAVRGAKPEAKIGSNRFKTENYRLLNEGRVNFSPKPRGRSRFLSSGLSRVDTQAQVLEFQAIKTEQQPSSKGRTLEQSRNNKSQAQGRTLFQEAQAREQALKTSVIRKFTKILGPEKAKAILTQTLAQQAPSATVEAKPTTEAQVLAQPKTEVKTLPQTKTVTRTEQVTIKKFVDPFKLDSEVFQYRFEDAISKARRQITNGQVDLKAVAADIDMSEKNTSGAAKKLEKPDGSLPRWQKALASLGLTSAGNLKDKVIAVLLKHRPVDMGQGEKVFPQEIQQVLEKYLPEAG